MMTTIQARQVAAELRRRLPGVGVKKVHKLLYYCQGHHLATFDEPFFIESISAWDMGPVVGQLWKSEKDHGITIEDSVLDESVLNTVGYVVSRYGALTGDDLERLTHSEEPWIDTDSKRDKGGTIRVHNDVMSRYFRVNAVDDDDRELQPDPSELDAWLKETAAAERSGRADTVDGIRARARSHG
jgi:uncharacterized phage-associated protein